MEKLKPVRTYFRQTFRRHSGAEYSELLTRGMREDGGVNRKYPWAYVRFFALVFVLFAIFLLIVRFTSNELFIPTITVLASVCFNISILLLIYELYPEKNLSFMAVCLAMLLGGAGANIISQILYTLVNPSDPWLHAVIAGFFEELPKAAAVVLIIVISRKSSPLAGFVFGAAVGCGFAVTEDMGYIFLQANELPTMNLQTIIEVSIARGASAVCTHIAWTATIGWAYCHFSRHLANLMVYVITLISCGLHIAWDLPVSYIATGFIYAGCAVIVAVECVLILYFERRKVFKAASSLSLAGGEQLSMPDIEVIKDEEESLSKSNPLYWRHWANFSITLGAFLMAIVAVIYCSIPFRETYGTETFSTPQSLVYYMQNGRYLDIIENRPYNDRWAEEDEERTDDRVIQMDEREELGITYMYEYAVSHDAVSGKDYYFPVSVSVKIIDKYGLPQIYYREDLYNDGVKYASFFRLRSDVEVKGFYFKPNGDVSVFIYDAGFERNLADWKYLSLFITFASIFAASSICYVSVLIKSWRVKKLCSTNNASSVK